MTTVHVPSSPTHKTFLICSFGLPTSVNNDNYFSDFTAIGANRDKKSIIGKITKKISETAEKVKDSSAFSDKYQCRAFNSISDEEISRTEEYKSQISGGLLRFHLPLFLCVTPSVEVSNTGNIIRIGLFKNNKRIFSHTFDPEHELKGGVITELNCGNEADTSSIKFFGHLIRRQFVCDLFRPGWSLTDPTNLVSHYSPSASCKQPESQIDASSGGSYLLNLSTQSNNFSSSNGKLHNYPLMCTYAFIKNNRLVTATERTIESTVVVPLATATLNAICGSLIETPSAAQCSQVYEISLFIQEELIHFINSCPGGGATLILYEAKEYEYGHELWQSSEQLMVGTCLKLRTNSTHLLVTLNSASNSSQSIMGIVNLTQLLPENVSVPVHMYTPSNKAGTINLTLSRRLIQLPSSRFVSHRFLSKADIFCDVGSQWLSSFLEKRQDDLDDLKRIKELYHCPPSIDFNTEVRL